MARFYGKIGFGVTEEQPQGSGVWVDGIREFEYYGDVIKNVRRWQQTSQVNDNVDISNSISIVADDFAIKNFHNMRYIEWMGALWKISSAEIEYPRIVLTIGGVYNGAQA